MKKGYMRFPGTKWYAFGTLRTRLLVSLVLLLTLALGGFLIFRPAAAASPNFNNEGISNDGVASSANYDGVGFTYSNQALQASGFTSGATVQVNGVSFPWPTVAAGTPDNWQAIGQTIALNAPGATILGFLGSATNGPSSGTVTLTYTDTTTQTFTLAFSDWTLNGGTASILPADSIAAKMSYRDHSNGTQQIKTTYLFFTSVALAPGKTLQSVTLPSTVSKGALHVFAIGTATPSSHLNNEGISNDGVASSANYDGVGFTYSNQALQASGFTSGATVQVNGVSFPWPTVAAGTPDNWQAIGQTIALNAPGATILGFLGSATNGPSSGTVTLTYTDTTTQTFTLAFSDWTLNAGKSSPLPADTIAAKMSYRDHSNGAKQTVTTYLFFTSVALAPGKTLQSVTLPLRVNQGALHVFALGTTAGPQGTATWPTYLGGSARSSFNAAETAITPQTAANLKKIWTAHAGIISDQPIVGNNLIYWGSWDGFLHATNFAGTLVWQTNVGMTTGDTSCHPHIVGVTGSAALGTVNGTPAVFIPGGNATFYALNALTGSILWQIRLGSSPAHFLWSSPLIANGSVYIGMSSLGDCPLVQGQLIQLNANTGAIQHVLNTVPNGCVGGGIWGTPTLDASTGVIYVTAGNAGSCSSAEPLAPAVIAVKESDLSVVSSWAVPASQQVFDSDFGSTPTLFTAAIPNTSGLLVGVENKNGFYYAFDRTNLAAGPVWEDQLAAGGADPEFGDGSISPSVWDGSTLYVAGGRTTILGTACAGAVRAVNPATGAFKWEACIQSGPVLAASTGIPGALVVGAGTSFFVLDSSTGKTLFTFHPGTSGAEFDGPATVLNGWLYEGCEDGNLYAFSL